MTRRWRGRFREETFSELDRAPILWRSSPYFGNYPSVARISLEFHYGVEDWVAEGVGSAGKRRPLRFRLFSRGELWDL